MTDISSASAALQSIHIMTTANIVRIVASLGDVRPIVGGSVNTATTPRCGGRSTDTTNACFIVRNATGLEFANDNVLNKALHLLRWVSTTD